ncbi:hypothetical protein GBA52_005497 [Prunus armeniaca]|nr:hypothetical protein GBA52_005497 [Prunus armeniaca]
MELIVPMFPVEIVLRPSQVHLLPEHGPGELIQIVPAEIQVVPPQPPDREIVDVDGVPDLDAVVNLELPGEIGHSAADDENPRVFEEGDERVSASEICLPRLVDEGLGPDVEAEKVVRILLVPVLFVPAPPLLGLGRDADDNGRFDGGLEGVLEPFGDDGLGVGNDG